MYAIINISGKQFKAEEGLKLRVPKQTVDTGKKLIFDEILMVHDGKMATFGTPTIAGTKVTATVLNHGLEKKILVHKKKRRKGYQRKNGHRQWFTEIQIQNINMSNRKRTATKKSAKPQVKK